MARDVALEEADASRAAASALLHRGRREAREEARDNQETGRERLLEKRRQRNEERRNFEAVKDDTLIEVAEEILLGSSAGDSFKAA